ncbi:MAG: hypothetical protein R3C01_16535 [Planctomycetaceae bacterium]
MTHFLTLSSTFSYYMNFYQNYLAQKWDQMTPMQYGTVLISIGVVGWLLMRGSGRR